MIDLHVPSYKPEPEKNVCFVECPEGIYGPNCKNNCSSNCAVPARCNVKTGKCIGGCQAGWTNSTCDESKTWVNLG